MSLEKQIEFRLGVDALDCGKQVLIAVRFGLVAIVFSVPFYKG